jgi:gamma-glutamylcyclotransferase (GGCT)/AIG2-like uncharacterized protein YtfP
MANMLAVNSAIRKAYPMLDIEAVRGDGYVYFCGDDAFERLDSIYASPVSTKTDVMVRLCLEEIKWYYPAVIPVE